MSTQPESATYTVDDETLDALRVVRNLLACSGLDMDDAVWRCLQIVEERFALAEPHPSGVGSRVPHNVERFCASGS